MDQRLLVKASSQDGVFTHADAASLGISGNDLTALVRQGEIIRIRRCAYVLAQVYAAAKPDEQYRLRVLAVMRTRATPKTGLPDRASHHSALALCGISFYRASRTSVIVESGCGTQRARAGLTLLRQSDAETYRYGDVRLVSAAAACIQVAARDGFEAGVCAMDSALHLQKCSIEDLENCVGLVPRGRRMQVRRAIAAADSRTESVGESRTRIILVDAGFSIVPQVEMRDGRDLLGRVDFLVDGCVVVEFDGLVKYEGIEGQYAIGKEKTREKRIRAQGYEFVRIIWSELDDPVSIVRQVVAARRDAQRRGVLAGL